MKISFATKSPKTDTLAVFVPEGGKLSGAAALADKKTGGAVKRAIAVEKFEGKKAQMALGMLLHSYRFDKYLTRESKDKKPTLKAAHFTLEEAGKAKKLFAAHAATADGVFLARDLASEPPNVLYPESFANIIRKEL